MPKPTKKPKKAIKHRSRLAQLEAVRDDTDSEPSSKMKPYALRLWAAREYRFLYVADLKLLSGVNIKEINRLQSTDDESLTDRQCGFLDDLAAALIVDPIWLRGEDGHHYTHAGIAEVLRHGLGALRQRVPSDTGMQPDAPSSAAIPTEIAPALSWVQTVQATWVRWLNDPVAGTFVGKVKRWYEALTSDEQAACQVPRHRLFNPTTQALPPIWMRLSAELVLSLGQAVLSKAEVACQPSLDEIEAALAWLLTDVQENLHPSRSAWDMTPPFPDIPDAMLETLVALGGNEAYQRFCDSAVTAWDAALGRVDPGHPDALARRAAIDTRFKALLRWAMMTPFPGEDPIGIGVAVGVYREFITRMRRDSTEARQEGEVIPHRLREYLERHPQATTAETAAIMQAIASIPPLLVERLTSLEGRVVSRAALLADAQRIVAAASGIGAELLPVLIANGWVAEVPSSGDAIGLLVLDEDDRCYLRDMAAKKRK